MKGEGRTLQPQTFEEGGVGGEGGRFGGRFMQGEGRTMEIFEGDRVC